MHCVYTWGLSAFSSHETFTKQTFEYCKSCFVSIHVYQLSFVLIRSSSGALLHLFAWLLWNQWQDVHVCYLPLMVTGMFFPVHVHATNKTCLMETSLHSVTTGYQHQHQYLGPCILMHKPFLTHLISLLACRQNAQSKQTCLHEDKYLHMQAHVQLICPRCAEASI